MNKILIVVDYQYDFASPEGALYVPEAETISQDIQRLINDKSFDKVIYTMDTHDSTYSSSEEAKIFPAHCEFNSKGWDLYNLKTRNREIRTIIESGILDSVKDFSIDSEFVFMKDKFSIWEGNSKYADFFKKNISKKTEIVIVGVATNYCVFQNAMGYIERGYSNVSIINNCVKGIKDNTYKNSIQIMKASNINFKEV